MKVSINISFLAVICLKFLFLGGNQLKNFLSTLSHLLNSIGVLACDLILMVSAIGIVFGSLWIGKFLKK